MRLSPLRSDLLLARSIKRELQLNAACWMRKTAADVKGTSTGGYGKNAQGSSFSRQNQMGADNTAAVFDDEDNEGRKTGYSTPGYLKEGGLSCFSLAQRRESRRGMRPNATQNLFQGPAVIACPRSVHTA